MKKLFFNSLLLGGMCCAIIFLMMSCNNDTGYLEGQLSSNNESKTFPLLKNSSESGGGTTQKNYELTYDDKLKANGVKLYNATGVQEFRKAYPNSFPLAFLATFFAYDYADLQREDRDFTDRFDDFFKGITGGLQGPASAVAQGIYYSSMKYDHDIIWIYYRYDNNGTRITDVYGNYGRPNYWHHVYKH